jgi:serine/threonine-protein kinase
VLRAGQKLGKYRLLSKLSVGAFATVFRAFDTLEGVYVALKIPHPNMMRKESIDDFTREVKMAARLDQDGRLHRWQSGDRVPAGRSIA